MKLNHLRDVVAVAERGSLRAAARHLRVAQPALTRSIREIEQELKATLFERRNNGVTLTTVGHAFLRRAIGIQQDLQRAKDEVDQLRGDAVGSVAVGLSTATHIALLPRVIERFRARYPRVRLHIIERLFPAIEGDLREGKIDFYVGPMGNQLRPAELGAELLFANQRIIVCRNGHRLSNATSLAELVDAEWITTSVTTSFEEELFPLFVRAGLPMPVVAAHAETALSMIAAAASSDLLTMLPQQWLTLFERLDVVRRIPVREHIPAADVCLVTRLHLPLTPAAEYLGDLFRRAAANHAHKLAAGPLS